MAMPLLILGDIRKAMVGRTLLQEISMRFPVTAAFRAGMEQERLMDMSSQMVHPIPIKF